MIAHIRGILTEKVAPSVIVDVQGVGYEITISQIDYDNLNLDDEVKLYTYHHVREQAEELFGFTSLAAKKIFELLISVQGVGPKAAIAILSLAPAEEVRSAIANGDSAYVSKASGVGKKTAERVIVDLKDKVGLPTYYNGNTKTATVTVPVENDEALDALMALGFDLANATKALEGIDPKLSVEERIRQALKNSR